MTVPLFDADTTKPRSKPRAIPILLMVRELDQGGVERDVAKIAMHMDRSRYLPHVATFIPRGFRYEELRAADIPILHLPVTSVRSPSVVGNILKFRRYVRDHGIQLVHSYDPSGIFGAIAGRLCRLPVITSQLGYRDLFDKRTQALLPFSDRLSHVVLVNCEAMRRYMVEEEHVPADRIELCYNGVDIAQ